MKAPGGRGGPLYRRLGGPQSQSDAEARRKIKPIRIAFNSNPSYWVPRNYACADSLNWRTTPCQLSATAYFHITSNWASCAEDALCPGNEKPKIVVINSDQTKKSSVFNKSNISHRAHFQLFNIMMVKY
jgi:hypothetical protein